MESWYRDSNDFVLKSNVQGIEKSEYHFVENGEWEISNLSSCPYRFMDFDNASFYTGIEFFITLKRRPSLIKICEPTRSAKYDIVSDDTGMDCDTSVKKTIIVRNCDEINCILKGVLLINIAVSPTLYTILVCYS
jgi:hypothetical protein